MLTYHDLPTIKHAISKRLSKERGVKVCDIYVAPGSDAISVGVLTILDHTLNVGSRFDLPPEFEIGHLHNEIDEIAEQYKAARKDFWSRGRVLEMPINPVVSGTGLRGLWAKHGAA